MAAKTGIPGVPGIAAVVALAGFWLVFAGIRDVPVFAGLRQVLRQTPPTPNPQEPEVPSQPTAGRSVGHGGDKGIERLVGNAAAAYPALKARFPHLTMYGWRAQGSVPGSDHPRGLAIDVMTANSLEHVQVIGLFRSLAGAKYWISRGVIASAAGGWRQRGYRGPSPHTDHVHLSFA